MKRIYSAVVADHLNQYQQMVFLSGPRQVGKTTISYAIQSLTNHFYYFNWDNKSDRELILAGPNQVAEKMSLSFMRERKPLVVFDEIHKYKNWRIFLKGFFDNFKDQLGIVVTGSAKLDIYRRGSDSLMGRYFSYRILPITIAELCQEQPVLEHEISPPISLKLEQITQLWQFGGFPEPFLKNNIRFFRRWQNLRTQQLFREDIRTLSHIQDIEHMEVLAKLLQEQAGQRLNLSKLAQRLDISIPTLKRWLTTLNRFYYCYSIKPWSKNVVRSLIKEPKLYLYDWSLVADEGQRAENFVATHLLKAVNFWTDIGLGEYDLFFVRDKEKREVDFLVTKDKKPWFLVEVKLNNSQSISEHLYRFHAQLKTAHAFQVVMQEKFVNVDCFLSRVPVIVPAATFLSQLV